MDHSHLGCTEQCCASRTDSSKASSASCMCPNLLSGPSQKLSQSTLLAQNMSFSQLDTTQPFPESSPSPDSRDPLPYEGAKHCPDFSTDSSDASTAGCMCPNLVDGLGLGVLFGFRAFEPETRIRVSEQKPGTAQNPPRLRARAACART